MDALQTLAEAHTQKLQAEQAVKRALMVARAQGATFAAIGEVLGVTRAGAKYLVDQAARR